MGIVLLAPSKDAGAIAVLSSLEKFPETPVKLRYELKHE
jgi:hypothetical protein